MNGMYEELRQRINNASFNDEFKQQIKSAQKEEGRKMYERLTHKVFGSEAYIYDDCIHERPFTCENKICYEGKAIDRLAAYEDSGLSPEEVQELKVSEKICEDCWNYALAQKKGRLIVLPCKVDNEKLDEILKFCSNTG